MKAPLWLSSAILRLASDEYGEIGVDRSHVGWVLDDFPPQLIEATIEAMLEYGSIIEVDGRLLPAPYEDVTE